MKSLPLFADIVEQWTIVSTGERAFRQRDGGRIVPMGDGTFRYRRPAEGRRHAMDELAEVRRLGRVTLAIVDETGPEPVLRFGQRGRLEPQ